MGKDYKGCAAHGDFRELINRKDIDVVGVATPDHWHVIPAIMAAKAGKDVICEKPLTLTVAEGRLLCDAIKQAGRIFQTASENRSIDTYIRIVELVRGGVVGKLKHIEVRLPIGNTSMRVGGDGRDLFDMRTVEDPPKSLNYEMWLGQAPLMPYIPARSHGNFRWNLAFSGGVLTDWVPHIVDLAQWGHDSERTGPVAVEGKGDFPPRDAVHNTAPTFEIHYQYADGVTMTVSAGQGDLDPKVRHEGPVVGRTPNPGIRFEGDEGWIESHGWRGSLKASRRKMLDAVIDPAKRQYLSPERNRRPHRRHRRRAPQLHRLREVAQAVLCPRRNRASHDQHSPHRQYRHAIGPQAAMEPRGRTIRRRCGGRRDAQPQTARAVDDRQHRLLDQEELMMQRMISVDLRGVRRPCVLAEIALVPSGHRRQAGLRQSVFRLRQRHRLWPRPGGRAGRDAQGAGLRRHRLSPERGRSPRCSRRSMLAA